MKKKLFALALCVIMVVAMAVPALAAPVSSIEVYGVYVFSLLPNTGLAMDVPFSSVDKTVNLFDKNLSKKNQQWLVGRYGSNVWLYANFTVSNAAQYVMCQKNTRYIGLVPETQAVYTTSDVDFLTIGYSQYRLHFPHINKYAKAFGTLSGNDVWLTPYEESSELQKWYVEAGVV